jgi:hypothetical protein
VGDEEFVKRVRIDVYHHFPGGIPVSGSISITLTEATPTRPPATSARLVVTPTKGPAMPGQITVDTNNETATVEFLDDKGDANALPPVAASGSPLVVTFASDNPAAATIATDATNPLQGDVTPTGEGVANLYATFAYADGSAVFEADGVTPFPDPAPKAITVTAGAATSSGFALSI